MAESTKSGITDEEKAAINAAIKEIDNQLAELQDTAKYTAVLDNGKFRPRKKVEMPVIMNGTDIDLNHIERIDFIIDNLLSPGLSMLAADPKIGKSWFSLLMCLCVAQGIKFLDYDTKKCNCLYFALEDSDNRMKYRIKQLYDGQKLPCTFNYSTNVNDLSNGLMEQLELVYNSMKDLRLIVIDTLQCIRGQYNNKDGGAYGYDYKEMNLLKTFAKEHNLSMLLIHHTSKADNPNDPFFSISGTRGLTGALDLMMVIKKDKAMDRQAKLYIRGRDIGEDAFVMEMKNCKWIKIGTLEDMEEQDALRKYRDNPIVRAINKAVEESGEWRGRMSELIEFADKNGICISLTPQKLTSEVAALEYQLNRIDNIQHGTINKGHASKIHVLKRVNEAPFS